MHLYFVLPILSSESDTNKSNCIAWMGVSYSDHIDNSDDENEKEEKYKVFANQSLEEFRNKDFNQFIYLDRIGNTDEAEGYNEAIKTVQKYSSNQSIVFQAVNEAFEQFDFVALVFGRPNGFGQLAAVVADHRVGGLYDMVGAAVVLFEFKGLQGRKVFFKIEDVVNGRPPEGVDALGVVAHGKNVF